MTVFNSGPINIEFGNSAEFTVEFLDSTGSLTVPSSASLSITYTNTSNTTTTDVIDLTLINSFFEGTWSSAGAALGLATWIVTGASTAALQATGQIRVLQRQSTY